ncbi:hypothetical protein KY285_023792 [Solanum tuberosum]|nr:hypothetical protein KY289_024118 [Solanum tuberosum]KAH0675991.1 hypothetical protein KY285_023792 [Solanum tuberosum]
MRSPRCCCPRGLISSEVAIVGCSRQAAIRLGLVAIGDAVVAVTITRKEENREGGGMRGGEERRATPPLVHAGGSPYLVELRERGG